MRYKLTTGSNVVCIETTASIPADPANADYAQYLLWLAEGNTPEPADPIIVPAPSVVTMRQARLALLASGLLSSVNSAVASADEATQIVWEFSSEVQRSNALISTLATALGLTDAQLDDLFTLAATL